MVLLCVVPYKLSLCRSYVMEDFSFLVEFIVTKENQKQIEKFDYNKTVNHITSNDSIEKQRKNQHLILTFSQILE